MKTELNAYLSVMRDRTLAFLTHVSELSLIAVKAGRSVVMQQISFSHQRGSARVTCGSHVVTLFLLKLGAQRRYRAVTVIETQRRYSDRDTEPLQ